MNLRLQSSAKCLRESCDMKPDDQLSKVLKELQEFQDAIDVKPITDPRELNPPRMTPEEMAAAVKEERDSYRDKNGNLPPWFDVFRQR